MTFSQQQPGHSQRLHVPGTQDFSQQMEKRFRNDCRFKKAETQLIRSEKLAALDNWPQALLTRFEIHWPVSTSLSILWRKSSFRNFHREDLKSLKKKSTGSTRLWPVSPFCKTRSPLWKKQMSGHLRRTCNCETPNRNKKFPFKRLRTYPVTIDKEQIKQVILNSSQCHQAMLEGGQLELKGGLRRGLDPILIRIRVGFLLKIWINCLILFLTRWGIGLVIHCHRIIDQHHGRWGRKQTGKDALPLSLPYPKRKKMQTILCGRWQIDSILLKRMMEGNYSIITAQNGRRRKSNKRDPPALSSWNQDASRNGIEV